MKQNYLEMINLSDMKQKVEWFRSLTAKELIELKYDIFKANEKPIYIVDEETLTHLSNIKDDNGFNLLDLNNSGKHSFIGSDMFVTKTNPNQPFLAIASHLRTL